MALFTKPRRWLSALFRRLFGPSETQKLLAQAQNQNHLLQAALIDALRVSQEQSKLAVTSIDRVIAARFDAPYSGPATVPQNATFPTSALSDQISYDVDDLLNLPDAEFLARS
jgi:type II secretory pathway pseudopilin PulG